MPTKQSTIKLLHLDTLNSFHHAKKRKNVDVICNIVLLKTNLIY